MLNHNATENTVPSYSQYIRGDVLDTHIYGGYTALPEKLHTTDDVATCDRNAIRLIHDLTEMINALKDYRLDLASRYRELSVRPTVPCVRLERREGIYGDEAGKIFFTLVTFDMYADDTSARWDRGRVELNVNRKRYTGRERRQAIADYKSYVRSHPGIRAESDIKGI